MLPLRIKDWFDHLAQRIFWEEVNFWRPSARHAFSGLPGSPFFFKLKAPRNAIGGFGLVSRFSRLPDWLAWECFKEGNGAASFEEMERRLNEIRTRNRFIDAAVLEFIRDHLDSAEIYRLSEADLECGELLPEKPGWLEQAEYEERTSVGFNLERLTKRLGEVVPRESAVATQHVEGDE